MNLISLENGAAVRLAPPRVRYASHGAGNDRHNHVANGFTWTGDDEHNWHATDGTTRLSVRPESGEGAPGFGCTILRISATAERASALELCGVEFSVESTTPPWYVSRECRWQRLEEMATLNDFGAFVVRWIDGGGITREMRSFAGTHSSRLWWKKGRLHISIYVDAAALHPRWRFANEGPLSTAAPVWQPGTSMEIGLLLREVGAMAGPPAIAARFPDGTEAAFVITDHCDFDDIERLEVFLRGDDRDNGWLGRGLRMTKGVFSMPSLTPRRRPIPTLSDPSYRMLIEELHSDGSEIAPHALNENGNIPGSTFSAALKSLTETWTPATWIDHGSTLEYCYTMGGAANPEYALLESLKGSGISTLWSYHDVPVQASRTLNLLMPPRWSHRVSLGQAVRHTMLGEPFVALHYLRSHLLHALKGTWGQMVMHSMSTLRSLGMTLYQDRRLTRDDVRQGWGKIAQTYRTLHTRKSVSGKSPDPHTPGELAEMAAVVYPERAVPLHQVGEEDFLLFTTLEAVHLRDAYTPGAVDRLLNERGLHLGHCYLLNNLPYIAGIFEHGANPVRLSSQWTRAVQHLSSVVRAERLWNPTVGQLAAWMRDMQHLSFIPHGRAGMTIKNPLSHAVHGVTLLLQPSTSSSSVSWDGNRPAGSRAWGDWLAVWGDVPAKGQIVVMWE